ncbi:putative amidase family protein [Paramyrothecium foliicola]|nr:putative amidase family protein [Paramyrothecium foliicola]
MKKWTAQSDTYSTAYRSRREDCGANRREHVAKTRIAEELEYRNNLTCNLVEIGPVKVEATGKGLGPFNLDPAYYLERETFIVVVRSKVRSNVPLRELFRRRPSTAIGKMALDLLTADAKTLQHMLEAGTITSASLVAACLAQIRKHDDYLHAMIQTVPADMLEATAKKLDDERHAGVCPASRCSLYAFSQTVSNNIATHPDTGLRTTAGSFSLWSSKPKENAKLVDLLIASGAIILGEANLREFSNSRGSMMPSGWSAIGGQTQSAYVRGGIDSDDSKDGQSNPSGSSSGSAVGVPAGYAPISIGTETDGSLLCPDGRAALYTIKPTVDLVPQHGIIPMSHNFDSAEPMTKTAYELAITLDVLASRAPSESYTSNLSGSWSGISVAFLDYSQWRYPDTFIKPMDAERDSRSIRLGQTKVDKFFDDVDLITVDAFDLDGEDAYDIVTMSDMKRDLTTYLQGLEKSEMRIITDIIEYNKKHADKELPEHHPRQDTFIRCAKHNISRSDYDRMFNHVRNVARDKGVERVFRTHEVNVIIGPADGFISTMAATGGYPVAAMPLSYLDCNGRPFGLAALAGRHQEALLVQLMSAWEATFQARKPPPALSGERKNKLNEN